MWIVLKKELLEMLREKRTLIFTFLVPTVVMPLMIGGFGAFAGYQASRELDRTLKYAVLGAEHAPAMMQRLLGEKKLERIALDSADAIAPAIKNGTLSFVLVVPTGFEQALDGGRSTLLELHYNDAGKIDVIGRRIRDIARAQAALARERYLSAHGFDKDAQHFVAEPIALVVKSTANERERIGELVGAFLPYLFVLIGFSASMSAAIDMGAGEKERGTLEALLLLPLPRNRLVLAKYCAIALLGCVAGTVGAASLGLWGLVLIKGAGGALEQVFNSISFGDFALIGLLMLPSNAIVAAVLLAISFYARSYREAANFGSVVAIFLIMPIALALMPNMQLHGVFAWVPITNTALAVKEIVKGTLDPSDLVAVFLSTLLVAGGLLWFCTVWCKREAVLFRS